MRVSCCMLVSCRYTATVYTGLASSEKVSYLFAWVYGIRELERGVSRRCYRTEKTSNTGCEDFVVDIAAVSFKRGFRIVYK